MENIKIIKDEDLRAWREERRKGRVQVQWDRAVLDDAKQIVSIRNINF